MSSSRKPEEVLAEYAARGLAGEMGFGKRPALLVVDLILGFTRPSSPLFGVYLQLVQDDGE